MIKTAVILGLLQISNEPVEVFGQQEITPISTTIIAQIECVWDKAEISYY
jgi:hypothetical protein